MLPSKPKDAAAVTPRVTNARWGNDLPYQKAIHRFVFWVTVIPVLMVLTFIVLSLFG